MTRINLEPQRAAGLPVVKRTALKQTFIGAVLKAESRDRLKRGDDGTLRPMLKPDGSGKHSQELVVVALALPGTTSPAGLGEDEPVIPEPGTVVRLILKGKSFGAWIEAKKALPDGAVAVGDVVTQLTATAQVYDASGNPSGPEISDQSAVDAARIKGRSVGIYGPITLRAPEPGSEWTDKAIAAYRSLQTSIPAETAPAYDSTPAPAWASAPAPGPDKPASIPQEMWDGMNTAEKKIVANLTGPPSPPMANAGPPRPDSIPEAEWNALPLATKETIAKTMSEAPF